MVFCLAKSFVPRVLIDFEIFQYQFAPNCNTERGGPCVGGVDDLCASTVPVYFLQDLGMATIANSFFPPPPPIRRGEGSGSLLFLPPPLFFSSRFIFRALIASSLCLPFSYWRHVISSSSPSSSAAGFRRFGERHRRFF